MTRIPLQIAALILFVTVIRAVLTLEMDLFSVESYLWVCSQRPALGYYDYPGMIAWMGWLSTTLFGHSPLGVRAVMIAGGAAMIWFVFLSARRLYDERVGRLAALSAALVPIFFTFAAEATPDAPCLLFWSACVWALAHALSGDSPRWWYPAGLFLGLAMDSKYHAVFLGFGVFGFLLLSPEQRGWLKRKEPWLAVLVALLAFLPTVIWNAQNGWQSFAYQGISRFRESGFSPSQLYKYPENQLLLLTPVLCLWAWGAGGATLFRWRRADWRDRFLAALGMPMLIFFYLVIFSRPVRGHWPVHGYLTALILSSALVLRGGALGRRLHVGSLAILAAAYLLSPLLGFLVPEAQRRGWTQLAREVDQRKADFVVCNEYHLASQMGYLLRTRESWELTPAGRPSKNFPNWWRKDEHLGKNAVIVYDSRHYKLDTERVRGIAESFERVDPPEEVIVPRVRFLNRGDDEKYMIWSAWNYRGPKKVFGATPEEDR
jgi:4-amino-4-deoxy-L-arabinose transferase-like glycosyltransferase